MKLVQFATPDAPLRVGLIEGDDIVDITNADAGFLSLLLAVAKAEAEETSLEEVVSESATRGQTYKYEELDVKPEPGKPHLLMPIHAPEVWGCGVTYKRSADSREDEVKDTSGGFYDHAYASERPEVFFKAMTSRCSGPNGILGLREDSAYMAPEPEMSVVVDSKGHIHGFTCANDVSAWDIERENPLYLPQSKTFDGCCCLGPCIATPDEIPDPKNIDVTCRVVRDGEEVFSGETNTGNMRRELPELIDFLTRSNSIPSGTVLMTGTGIILPEEEALKPGDVVEIMMAGIGMLRNYGAIV